ncbi:hypothetical protein [Streptomyces sp. NPDC050738]|uniref:hypothetical protein n=1 Tax=Streptomyces sp. NPDC050738 TaxID=3154744 RepID=UPI00342387FB
MRETLSGSPWKRKKMRFLASSSVAAATVCATLSLGVIAPAEAHTPVVRSEGQIAPVSGATVLLRQMQTLGEVGGLLTPVTNLIEAALTTEGHRLSAGTAQRYLGAVTTALANVTPATPSTSTATSEPSTKAATPPDLKADALKDVRKYARALATAATAGNGERVLKQAQETVNSMVKFMVATVLTGGLPTPQLPGLPTVAKPSAAASVPRTPKPSSASTVPKAPSVPKAPRTPAAVPATPNIPHATSQPARPPAATAPTARKSPTLPEPPALSRMPEPAVVVP